MDVALSRVINVTLLSTPQGLANFNVNSLSLFTNETPGAGFGSDGYKIYTSPDGVATDFGTASETYLQAVAVFSQSPNILTGGGYLVVIPLLTNGSPTSGTMLTETPGALAAFNAITSGGFKATINGSLQDYTGLDFSDDTTMAEVATTINTAVSGDGGIVTYDATANSNTGGLLFTSTTTGATSKISKLSAPSTGTDISGAALMNGASNPRIINGQAGSTSEDLVSAIVRTNALVYYFGVLTMTIFSDSNFPSGGVMTG